MPTTNISLENLFSDKRYLAAHSEQRQRLFHSLKSGDIRAVSAEWVKVRLRHVGDQQDLRSAIKQLPISDEEKAVAFAELEAQDGPLYRVYTLDGGYYTLRVIRGQCEIYHYGYDPHDRETHRITEIDESFWKDSWVDEVRWVVVNDDVTNRIRREFKRVSFLRSDILRFHKNRGVIRQTSRGRRPYHEDPAIVEYAELLLRRHPSMSRVEWGLAIKERHAEAPGKSRLHDIYGWIWTKHDKIQKSRN